MMAKESTIVVVGSANVDLTTFNDVFPRPGETIFGKKFDLGFGGKGANQAMAARLCGASVGMVAKVGSDLFGPATIKNFESQGIDATYVGIAEGVSSGVAPIFVDPSGQNRIIVVKGANDTLSPEDVDAAAPLLRKADTIVMQFEVPLRTVYHAVRFAKANGVRCIVNPAPAQPVDFKELAAADYFIPNEGEAEVISGMPVTSADEAKKCAQFLLQQGMRRVVITLGERGCLVAGPGEVELIPAVKNSMTLRDNTPTASTSSLDRPALRGASSPADTAIANYAGRDLQPNRGIPLNLDWVDEVRVNNSAEERRAQTLVTRRT